MSETAAAPRRARRHRRPVTRRAGRTAAAVTMALLALTSVQLAGATPTGFEVPLTGTSTFGGETEPLPDGSLLSGTLDTATGALAADATFPETTTTRTVEPVPGFPVEVSLVSQVVQVTPLAGTVDATSGATSGTMQLELHLKRASGAGQTFELEPCRLGPFDLDLTGELSDGTLRLADPDVVVPPTEDDCGGLADAINDEIAGSSGAIELVAAGLPTVTGSAGGGGGSGSDTPAGDPGGAATPVAQAPPAPPPVAGQPAAGPAPVPLADTGLEMSLLLAAGTLAAGVGLLTRRALLRP